EGLRVTGLEVRVEVISRAAAARGGSERVFACVGWRGQRREPGGAVRDVRAAGGTRPARAAVKGHGTGGEDGGRERRADVERHRPALVGAEHGRVGVEALARVGYRVAAADDRLVAFARERVEKACLEVGALGEPERGRDVVVSG